ncbi:disease resistance protein At4g27190-like [Prosopis cineraria]|uniref:disease resistance protein At4g27190-like n=1 Tax=Prosopis cineraria TaxID=364024 RepID=UPI00240EB9AB|nr:disease resistance protein At4g27190-like [Prosopis cineraria]XP_054796885.1 disease resistance protein At4g27190-like [Prosopis cineraria]XP_054796886.1 disease resistance protein At4g27190-like [Prosopis cineraria]
MADIVISIGAKVAEGLVKPTIRQAQYIFCVKNVVKNLGNEKNELVSERDRILSLVEQAKERTEIIEKSVEKWLNDVKNLLVEVERLEQEMKENHCCQGQIPTWRRYCLCKEMVKKIKRIACLKNNGKFEPFSHLGPLPSIEYISSLNFTYFESTKEAYNQLMEAIQDDNTYMIGLYGMGGSGKTNLAKEVGRKALQLNLCDRVIFVTVSQTPNVRGIQGKIADMLCMTLKEEIEEGRAQRLWLRLKEEKRVLLIVDDVWAKLNLESIGFLLDDNSILNFKVLLTTRLRQVCASMECQREIILNLLSQGEAWILFQKHARIGNRFSCNLLKVAREVSNECKGLPIAIEAVACSLKGKGDDEWKVALESLRGSEPFDDHEGEGVGCAYNCLKLSYDYLRNKEAEMLLLLCSLFPEDHEIFIEDLIKYGVGLGLCGTFNSFDLARSRIRAGINKLVDSFLLLHLMQSEHYVKMHDMVRDVALWIASKSVHQKILVDLTKDLNSLAEDGAMKDSFAVSSWCKEIDTIYHHLDAPKLEILLINTMQQNSLNFMLPSFEGVKRLKVMAMINSFYQTPLLLPQSTHCLTNLRALRLRGWDLGDMSFIVSLTRLEILDLSNCYFKDLPKGMEKLSKLKLLDLSHYEIPENLNYEAIGSCLQLEELYAFGYTQRCHCQRMEDIVTLPSLQRFVIYLGKFETLDNEESVRVLQLLDFSMSNLGASKQNLLQRAEVVCLENLL